MRPFMEVPAEECYADVAVMSSEDGRVSCHPELESDRVRDRVRIMKKVGF